MRAVAAIDSKRGIARAQGIPWDLPSDKRFYRNLIKNDFVVMGKRTYETHAKPLSRFTNFVLTREVELRPGFVHADNDMPHDTFVIGGQEVFEKYMPEIDQLFLTIVEGDFGCSRFFPEYEQDFVEVSHEAHSENNLNFAFTVWERKQ